MSFKAMQRRQSREIEEAKERKAKLGRCHLKRHYL